MIMGTGIFIMLCGLTYMLEVKDSKNRHFIVGDIYNNFLYNADPARSNQPLKKLSCLPTITSTMQAQLTQRDHDSLLAQRVESTSSRNSRRINRKSTVKSQKTIDWADRQCRHCAEKRLQEQEKNKQGGILRQRNPETFGSTPSFESCQAEITTAE